MSETRSSRSSPPSAEDEQFARDATAALEGNGRITASCREDGGAMVYEMIFQHGSRRGILVHGRGRFVESDMPVVLAQFRAWRDQVPPVWAGWAPLE